VVAVVVVKNGREDRVDGVGGEGTEEDGEEGEGTDQLAVEGLPRRGNVNRLNRR